jgi:hypothetical protein
MFGFELGDVENWVNANSAGETKGERHSGGLRDYGERADLLLSEFASGAVCADVIGANEDSVSDTERRRGLAIAVCVGSHSVLRVLHPVAKELVDLIEVNGEMSSTEVGYFSVWVYGD